LQFRSTTAGAPARSAKLSGERLARFLVGALVHHGAGASLGAAGAARLVGGAPRGPADVARRSLGASAALLERSSLPVAYLWRYALALEMVGKPCLFDRARLSIGACGDWCLGGRVEAASLSGRAIAGRLLRADGLVGQGDAPGPLAHSA
jgi:hypothetical protein